MSAATRSIGTMLMVGLVLYLSGCAFLRGSATGSAFVENDMRHLRLPGTSSAQENKAVAYRSPYGYEEYDRSQASGRAEALFLRTTGTGIALEIESKRLEYLTRRWAYNRSASSLTWPQARARVVPGTAIRYRLYRHHNAGGAPSRPCVAFIRTWAFNSLDPLQRPARAYFGYWCRPAGQMLSADAAETYLRHISIVSSPLLGFHLGQAVPHDTGAQAQASAATDSNWGITPFPFKRFRRYPIGGSYSSSH